MNYKERDTFGMYKAGPSVRRGPGPGVMSADNLVGNDVSKHKGEHRGFLRMGEKLFVGTP